MDGRAGGMVGRGGGGREMGPVPRRPYAGPRHVWRTDYLARALLEAAPAEGLLLDAGCGYGRLAMVLATAGRRVVAFDSDPAMVAAAQRGACGTGVEDRLRWLEADVTAIPLAGASVVGVACGEVLEHVADDRAAVGELARVLAPGGVLALTVPAGAARFGPVDLSAGHLRRYDRADVAALLVGAGFEVERLTGWGFPFGRLYEAVIQRPALAVRRRPLGRTVGWLASSRLVTVPWRWLFRLEEYVPAGEWAGGWLAVARR